jgi:6-pyruvoyltetrahydropterin/6-carboxytetrahydropterin synthase
MTASLTSLVPSHRAAAATWTIHLEKEYHKFSAAHFLIFGDGTAERLHGHNYRVAVDLDTPRTNHGMVIDFKRIKPLVTEILAPLDERVVIPGLHPDLTCRAIADDETEIRYGKRRYIVPTEEVCVLPILNSSSENLAEWIATSLLDAVRIAFPSVQLTRLAVCVEETPGQQGIFTLKF